MNLCYRCNHKYTLLYFVTSLVTEEEFRMGYLDLKPASSLSLKSVHATTSGNVPNMSSELPKHHDSNALRSAESHKQIDDSANRVSEGNATKGTIGKRSVATASVSKQPKPDLVKINTKSKPVGTINEASAIAKGSTPHDNNASSKSSDKPTKRTSPAEEQDRFTKRRKEEHDSRDSQPESRSSDKPLDKPKNKRYDRDYRERFERSDKSHGDDVTEKSRDRSMERHSRERSVDKGKNDRNKVRYNEILDKSLVDDRFRRQSLPPPLPFSFELSEFELASDFSNNPKEKAKQKQNLKRQLGIRYSLKD
ncbi:THO complex subunit 2 isoform X1 [Tanacetum coccineum]